MATRPATHAYPWFPEYRYPSPIQWDIVREHFDEVAFLWKQWKRSLLASDCVLAELEDVYEQRLFAHVEGLVFAGRPAAERLLLATLEGDDPDAGFAAADALLSALDADWLDLLIDHATGGGEASCGILGALAMSDRADVTAPLLQCVPELLPVRQAAILDVLRFRRADISCLLPGLRLHNELELLVAVLRAARYLPQPLAAPLVQARLSDDEPRVRAAALEAGLLLGLRAAWTRCPRAIEARGDEARVALLALADAGDRRSLEEVFAAAESQELRAEALWALGFSGQTDAARFLLKWLDGRDGRLAADSLSLITGLPLEPPFVFTEEEEEQIPAEDGPECLLPAPAVLPGRANAEMITRWCMDKSDHLGLEGRHLYALTVGPDHLLRSLERLPMCRRAGVLWGIAVRSRGACNIEPRAWVRVQREQGRAVRSLRPATLTASLGELLTM